MDAGVRAWILIAGSDSERAEPFRVLCEAVGAALVEAGFGVVAGSFSDDTADAHVLRGALRVRRDAPLRVIRPGASPPTEPGEEFADIPWESVGRVWNDARPALVDAADAAVLLSGGKGTEQVYEGARRVGKPVVAVPGLGGVSQAMFDQDERELLSAGVSEALWSQLKSTEPTDVARGVVAILDQLLGRPDAEEPNAPAASTGKGGPEPFTSGVERDLEQKQQAPQAQSKAGGEPPRGTTASSDESERTGVFLLTWDPERTSWPDLSSLAQSELGGWTVSEGVRNGDRFYFMRHGEDRPGLVGVGRILSDARQEPHWDPAKSEETALYADVAWDSVVEHPRISQRYLVEKTHEEELWTRPGNGHPVPEGLVEQLDELWRRAERGLFDDDGEPRPETATGAGPAPGEDDGVREGGEDRTQDETPADRRALGAWIDTDAIAPIRDRGYRATERDSLNAQDQAGIFASLLVAADLEPPLALGLFGDWGVGKTFFMRIMQEKIRAATEHTTEADEGGSISRVAQIEFNAWHYVDSDLWASLASRIFDGLAEELGRGASGVDEARRELRRKIESSEREKREAEAAIEVARDARARISKELAGKRRERDRKVAALDDRRLQRVWTSLVQENPELKASAREALSRLGFDHGLETAAEVRRLHETLSSVTSRGAALSLALSKALTGRRLWVTTGLVVAVLGVVIALPEILGWLSRLVGQPPSAITPWIERGVQLVTVVGSVLAWVGSRLDAVPTALGALERVERELRRPLGEPPPEEARLAAEVEELNAEVASQEQQIGEAERQIALATEEIQRIDSGGLVYDFLDGKVRDSRYIDRLGLISVIRQDFERLRELLTDWVEHAAPIEDRSARPVERIILYIDDLDRCEPERVVEVLQAVHLLLAFDLFVVVVGVDARWLERSLNERYNPRGEGDGGRRGALHRFDAHNYLEKIFQIPFSLPRMAEGGFQQLVRDITASPKKRAEDRERRAREAETGRALDAAVGGAVREGAGEPEQAGEEGPVQPPRGVPSEPGPTTREGSAPNVAAEAAAELRPPSDGARGEVVDASATVGEDVSRPSVTAEAADETLTAEQRARSERAEAERRERERARAEQRIRAMMLEEWEEQYMGALYPFLRTPRLTKRFINVYRLLRVRIASEGAFDAFIDRSEGGYRAVLTLLAITVGRPDVAPDLLEAIHGEELSSVEDWLRDGLRDRPELAEEADRFRVDLREVIRLVGEVEPEPLDFDDDLTYYRQWASEVGRYSFRWHLRDGGGGDHPHREGAGSSTGSR